MSSLRACDLRTDAVYVSPRGRLVRLLPSVSRGPGSDGGAYQFAYVGSDRCNKRSEPDGFWLSVRNLHILRAGAVVRDAA
jgi:hypothetical protein